MLNIDLNSMLLMLLLLFVSRFRGSSSVRFGGFWLLILLGRRHWRVIIFELEGLHIALKIVTVIVQHPISRLIRLAAARPNHVRNPDLFRRAQVGGLLFCLYLLLLLHSRCLNFLFLLIIINKLFVCWFILLLMILLMLLGLLLRIRLDGNF